MRSESTLFSFFEGVRVVLFDFDMTLADSSHAILHCTNLLAGAKSLPVVTREQILSVIGLPIEESWRTLWGRYDPEWLDYYRGHFRGEENDRLRLFDDARATLETLKNVGMRLGVVSNRRYATHAVERVGIDDLLDVVIGLEDIERPKPDPQSIRVALARLTCPPEAAAYVGDTDIDMKTAVAAAVRPIGVTRGNFDAAALRTAGAWKTVARLADLLK